MKTAHSPSALGRLQRWYLAQCNGCWEHQNGVTIDTLDNPGWSLSVDLRDTGLSSKAFDKLGVQREDEDDWLRCWVEEGHFKGYCGPLNLGEVLRVFLDWAESLKLE